MVDLESVNYTKLYSIEGLSLLSVTGLFKFAEPVATWHAWYASRCNELPGKTWPLFVSNSNSCNIFHFENIMQAIDSAVFVMFNEPIHTAL